VGDNLFFFFKAKTTIDTVQSAGLVKC